MNKILNGAQQKCIDEFYLTFSMQDKKQCDIVEMCTRHCTWKMLIEILNFAPSLRLIQYTGFNFAAKPSIYTLHWLKKNVIWQNMRIRGIEWSTCKN